MDDAPGRSRGRVALRLALALPLACVLLVGALWVGQELRAYRAPASSPASTDDGAAQAGAAQPIGQPIQVIQLPPGLTDQVSIAIASPDGAYFVTRTADFTRLALVRVLPAPDDAYLKTDLVATLPDVNFVAWLPDATGFIAQGTKVANTPATPPPFGTKLESKLFDVYRVDLAGATTKLGVAAGGIFALSPDAKLIAAFDGDARLIAIHTDGTGIDAIANDPAAGSAPSLLGWDASGAILRADWRAPFTIRRVPLAGPPSVLPSGGVTSALLARSSPDRRGALLTASFPGQCECDALLTDRLTAMPDGTYPAWVGPHSLLTRAADERAGMLDVLTSARTTLSAKMRSEQIRIIAVSMPYVLWLDVTKAVPHLLDVRADRDTGLGLSPPPANAQPLSGGRFFAWREKSLLVLDAGAFFRTIPATPSPIPLAKDQSGVPAGFIRVARPEGGWSVVIPSAWYRRDAPLRGSEFTSYDPEGMDYSGNAPPAGGARVVIEAANDYGASDLHEYAKRAPIAAMPGNVVRSAADVSVAGQPAYTVTTSVNQPPPFDADLRFWFVRSPYFSDRVFVIQASVARAQEVDAIVASLRFFAPAPDPAPTLTRAQVVAKYSQPTFSATRVDRVEAKLVRWKDYEKAAGGFRSGTNDPDELTWVVVVSGEIQAPNRGPAGRPTPAPGATPQTFPYEVHAFSANAAAAGGMYQCCGPDARPVWFDILVDLASPGATGSPSAAATCAHSGYDGTVVGAFTLRAADLAQQDETPRGGPTGPHPVRSSFRDYPADTPIVLCFFDGFIAAPGGPPPQPPATFRPYDRYVLTVDPSGKATLAVAGHQDTIAVAPRLP